MVIIVGMRNYSGPKRARPGWPVRCVHGGRGGAAGAVRLTRFRRCHAELLPVAALPRLTFDEVTGRLRRAVAAHAALPAVERRALRTEWQQLQLVRHYRRACEFVAVPADARVSDACRAAARQALDRYELIPDHRRVPAILAIRHRLVRFEETGYAVRSDANQPYGSLDWLMFGLRRVS